MVFKCCVGGCESTSNTHQVYCFPKNDSLRNLWMSFVVPTNPLLIGLTKEQLLRKRICAKHFDKHQFDEEGKRLRYSYPCLFTADEIAQGEPLCTAASNVRSVLSDHNYCREDEDDDDDSTVTLVVVKAGDNSYEHPSYSQSHAVTPGTSKEGGVLDQPTSSMEIVASRELKHTGDNSYEHPSYSQSHAVTPGTSKEGGVLDQPTSSMEIVAPRELKHTGDNSYEHPSYSQSHAVTPGTSKEGGVLDQPTSSMEIVAPRELKHTVNSSSPMVPTMFSACHTSHMDTKHGKKTFVLMQLKQCQKNKMARRFTLEEKLIALVLMKQSPKAYKLMQHMFALPNKRTLSRLSEGISIQPGLNPGVFKYIESKTRSWDTQQKLCTIVFDEISLTPHLNYNEKNDLIQGFVDVTGERTMKICDHALVFMLRGICSSWRQSVAFYFCEGTTSAAALQNILKQIVSQVALAGLIPLGLVCDQGSTFRTALKTLREDTIRMRSTQNIKDDGSINIAGHDLSIFFDPPHLLKGVRNNFVTKDLIWEEKIASWKDIQFIYDLDSKLGHTRALPKLTAHHVDPNKIKKMKVSVAAQVFSARTAAMLKYTNALNMFHAGPESASTMETTAEVIEFFDTLFDSVNCYPGGATKGKLRRAVKKNSPHHSFWANAIKKLKALKFVDSNSKHAIQAGKPRLVRVPSLEGWNTTLESFIRISKLLFEKFGVEYYYPRNINQDPLENFFGRIRALNYRNVNPDANTFIYAYKSLVLSNFLSPHSKHFNCEVDNGQTLIDVSFLFSDSEMNKENDGNLANIIPSTSQTCPSGISRDQIILEKVKVQCSAYTAGFICRKMTRALKCPNCVKTYIAATEENIHTYIRYREFKSLKNNNLAYPSAKFLMLYRDASTYIHNYLNLNCDRKNVKQTLISILQKCLRFSWLGCDIHCALIKNVFLKYVIRLHVHNWCNIINKILKGNIEDKYVLSMAEPQKMALKKYKSLRLRKKAINK